MGYQLVSKFGTYHSSVVVVGCGGTGGFAAEGLARLLTPEQGLILIDGDRVEERNLVRQNFYPEDLGRFKAQAMAGRLSRKYQRPIAYSVAPVAEGWRIPAGTAVVLGCVDNAAARSAIAREISPRVWCIDAGNDADFGQVLVGNISLELLGRVFDPKTGLCYALPLPTLVRPELLVAPPASCAGPGQGPTINQFMAALLVETVRQLMEGRLSWWQMYLDLEAMAVRTVPPTPEGVSRITRVSVRRLVERR